MNTGIYKIENILNGNCYIGQSVNLYMREHQHSYNLKNDRANPHFQNAYNKYGKENFRFDVLLYCEDFELTRYEQWFIDTLNPKYNICRDCVDSTKGIKHTEEARNNMSLAAKQRMTEEYKEKLRLANVGRKMSEEHKEKLILANLGNTYSKGKKHTEEHRHKVSIALTGRKHTEETKQKMSLAQQNRSAETKQKMSLAQKGKKLTDEHKQKMSLSRTGKKLSEEWKQNISLGQKARHERERLQRQQSAFQVPQ